MTVKQQTARWVFNKYYASPMLELVHPGNLAALPPSPRVIARKAMFLGLMEKDHEWIVHYL